MWSFKGRALTCALLALVTALAVVSPASAARNILLLIADDYGIDVTRYYPLTDRRVTDPPAPATPNLASRARTGSCSATCGRSRAARRRGRPC